MYFLVYSFRGAILTFPPKSAGRYKGKIVTFGAVGLKLPIWVSVVGTVVALMLHWRLNRHSEEMVLGDVDGRFALVVFTLFSFKLRVSHSYV